MELIPRRERSCAWGVDMVGWNTGLFVDGDEGRKFGDASIGFVDGRLLML